jgi:hypothetical protein
MRRRALGVVLVLALPWVASGQPTPAGGEFQVNTYTIGFQSHVRVAMNDAGNFVVVWQGDYQDGEGTGAFGRRYDAAGGSLGGPFQVNTYTLSYQVRPIAAMDRERDDFTVVWTSEYQDGSFDGIFGQRYDATGAPLGSEFRVNTYTTNTQFVPAIAMDRQRRFVVVWQSSTQDGAAEGIFGQRYDAAGVRLGGEFQINTYTTSDQYGPAIAMEAGGSFVVVWASTGQDGYGGSVFGQRFDAAGARLGSEFQVNTYTTGNQYQPAIAMDQQGRFVVVLTSEVTPGQDGSSNAVAGQRFDAAGARLGSEFLVNAYTTSDQSRPTVAADTAGNFVVIWHSFFQDGSNDGVFGRRFDAAGAPRGGEFRVNTYTTNRQYGASVASDPHGNFVVVWASYGQDGDRLGIYGQRYGGLVPAALAVDASGNGVLEPGETVVVAPSWRNINGSPLTFTGAASALTGPPGATYTLADAAADYGTVANAAIGSCGTDCFQVSVSNPATRPATHWDLTVLETIGPPALGQTKIWTLHVGESFPDVPPTHPFYRFVETLLHVGVTAGCTATTYCPDGSTTREQMAVFLLRAREGGGFTPPPCTTAPFPDVPCASPFAPWVQELVARGITSGCGGGLYCPTNPVTREQMAVFLLKTLEGAGFTPPPCTTASFTDMPCASPFAAWVQELVARGITAGCGGGLYCPTNPVTRGQMAVFLTKTFALSLYGL